MQGFEKIQGISRVWTRQPTSYGDNRGVFFELSRDSLFEHDVPRFIQDNISYSKSGVVRGMHVQENQWQLVTIIQGSLLDLVIDIDPNSHSFGAKYAFNLEPNGIAQLLFGPGVAHGYQVIDGPAIVHYKSSIYYGKSRELGINWKSPQLENQWAPGDWIASDRDANFPLLSDFEFFK
jgi:dTDP-4-dehydrorhamnose 3,5-epimerase